MKVGKLHKPTKRNFFSSKIISEVSISKFTASVLFLITLKSMSSKSIPPTFLSGTFLTMCQPGIDKMKNIQLEYTKIDQTVILNI